MSRSYRLGLVLLTLVFLHNTLPLLTMLPRVNVDEPWLMERAWQLLQTGAPSQPMLRLETAYLLQPGYAFLHAPWMVVAGVGIYEARLLTVLLGLGTVLLVSGIGRRLLSPEVGLLAAAFLVADSNFLGNARTARTDIPSVFFAAAALYFFLVARAPNREGGARNWPHVLSGAAAGLAMLMHGNAYWVVVVLFAWYLQAYRLRLFTTPPGYLFSAGLFATFGPYLAVIAANWSEFQVQVGNFAGDRVPSLSPGVFLAHIAAEAERYRGWYFGLVTNDVPNPLLWAFQAATAAGLAYVMARALIAAVRREPRPSPWVSLALLSVGSSIIFAGFIPNKAHVYMPNLLIGFSLAGAAFGVDVVRAVATRITVRHVLGAPAVAVATLVLVAAYSTASVAYYEKWYSTQRRSALVPFEQTAATLEALVPEGPKYIFASPNFWTPFHDQAGVRFLAYTGATPYEAADGRIRLGQFITDDRPIYLMVDESEWRTAVVNPAMGYAPEWRDAWTRYITEQCTLSAVAYGTAYANIGLYRCWNDQAPEPEAAPRIVGGGQRWHAGAPVLAPTPSDMASWDAYLDPRRTAAAPVARVSVEDHWLHITGAQWPGVATDLAVTPGQRYLVTFESADASDGDLLYLGHWDRSELLSLSGASGAGIFAPLEKTPWFPGDRAFTATGDSVWLRIYSEAPSADFRVRAVRLLPLEPERTGAP